MTFSLVHSTQADSLGQDIFYSDWLQELSVCQCGRQRKRWAHIWQQLWGGKEGQHQAIWQSASVCVCLALRVCVFIKSQGQLQKIVWFWLKTQYCSLASKSNPAVTFVGPTDPDWFIIINSYTFMSTSHKCWCTQESGRFIVDICGLKKSDLKSANQTLTRVHSGRAHCLFKCLRQTPGVISLVKTRYVFSMHQL